MHLHENTLFELGVKVKQNVAQYPQHHVTYAPELTLMLLHPTVKEKMHLQENTLFDLDLWVTRNVAQCDLFSYKSLKLLRLTV